MKCHYEILGVSKESTDDEIKKSYRKLALQWHPDKNPDRIDECTKQFHLIQQAYEVLTDPQERVWYDKHREAILRGGLGHGDDFKDDSLDVYQYFNSSCYSGFDDGEKGFYTVFDEVFKKISQEDQEYRTDDSTVPVFGNSLSSYEEVVGPFYGYWESYCTAKSYVWVEKYDTREAPNRQIRRLMEQDNKKLRDKARRERNEEVWALVAFIRKRDRRVQAYKKKLEERAIEIAKRAEEKKIRDRQQRLKNLENYKESSWSSMSELERELKQLEVNVARQFGDVDSDDEYATDDELDAAAADDATTVDNNEDEFAAYMNPLYCIACNKSFKSEKALDNHNGSKKHIENVNQLQLEMTDDDKLVAAAGDNDDVQEDAAVVSDEELDKVEEFADMNSSRSKSKKQRKKQRQLLKVSTQTEVEDDEEPDEVEADKNCDEVVDETKPLTDIEERTQVPSSTDDKISSNEQSIDATQTLQVNGVDDQSQKKPKNKKSSKANVTNGSGKISADGPSSNIVSLACNKCHKVFSTRNKLFDHIKETGHALHVDTSDSCDIGAAASNNKSAKSKKGKRR